MVNALGAGLRPRRGLDRRSPGLGETYGHKFRRGRRPAPSADEPSFACASGFLSFAASLRVPHFPISQSQNLTSQYPNTILTNIVEDTPLHQPPARESLEHLTARIRAVEGRFQAATGALPPLPTGWPAVDQVLRPQPEDTGKNSHKIALGGLPRRAIHEWFAMDRAAGRLWTPPICILVHLAWQALLSGEEASQVVWVGRCVWPHPKWLARQGEPGRSLLQHSTFVDPEGCQGSNPGAGAGVWAIDVALRNPLVAMVIADGTQLNMAATRRLQLAAEANNGLGLLARPASDLAKRSAATTRWRVGYASSTESSACWTIELIRNRSAHRWGGPFTTTTTTRWTVQWNHETGTITVPADVASRLGQESQTQKSDTAKRRWANAQTA